jgi:hypothetical protein
LPLSSSGMGRALPEVLLGKTAGQGSGSPGLEVPERHSYTEEVTGSSPVRPTQVSGHDDLLGVMAFPLTLFVVDEISCVSKHRRRAWATGCP